MPNEIFVDPVNKDVGLPPELGVADKLTHTFLCELTNNAYCGHDVFSNPSLFKIKVPYDDGVAVK